ncbi:MAG: DUF1624 domain-containing protein [Candidatus Aenigmarchaeota archaeon]|nr:DUF1624 domain-containing protein [Candidatus Aenigmarchaeota archaeon]
MKTKRLWEIDAARGIAIIMMVISNLALDLAYFRDWGIDIYSGFWLYFARATAASFIFIAGVSLALSYSRLRRKAYKKYLFRGLRIFSLGLAITAVTFILFPQNIIWFGILHLIGFSIVISYPFLGRKAVTAFALGIAIIIMGLYLGTMTIDSHLLLWLGLKPGGFSSFDHEPVFPWYGLFLLGISLGSVLYSGGKRSFSLGDFSGNVIVKPLAFLGRHSLFIYLAHQPVIVGLILSGMIL